MKSMSAMSAMSASEALGMTKTLYLGLSVLTQIITTSSIMSVSYALEV